MLQLIGCVRADRIAVAVNWQSFGTPRWQLADKATSLSRVYASGGAENLAASSERSGANEGIRQIALSILAVSSKTKWAFVEVTSGAVGVGEATLSGQEWHSNGKCAGLARI